MVYLVPRSHSCHSRAITAGIQGTLQAARDRETRREPSTYPWVRALPKLTVRVRFPSPAPHAKNVAAESSWRIPVLCESVFSSIPGPPWATHIRTSAFNLSVSEGRSACSALSARFFQSLQTASPPQLGPKCGRARFCRREEAPAVPSGAGASRPEMPVRLTIVVRTAGAVAGLRQPERAASTVIVGQAG